MRLLSWNINSVQRTVDNAKLKFGGSWKGFFEYHGLDVLCIQEAKVPEDKLTKELCCVDGFQSFWACSKGKKGYSGVTTYCSTAWAPIACELDALSDGEDLSDSLSGEGRFVSCDFGAQAFVLINVYVPNAGDRPDRPRLPYKKRFLRALAAKVHALTEAGREVLLVGDFNVCSDERDVHPGIGLEAAYSQEERELFGQFSNTLVDVWRKLNPNADHVFTVWDEKTSARAFNRGLRIDFVLATPGLAEKIHRCEVLGTDALPPKWSDHAGIMVEIEGVEAPPKHPPCKEWRELSKRFIDPTQRSILSMFGKRKEVTQPATEEKKKRRLEGDRQRDKP